MSWVTQCFGAVLNQRLEGQQYVTRNGLTLADLTLASSLMYAERTEAPLADFPNLQSWFSRMSNLDAWRNTSPS